MGGREVTIGLLAAILLIRFSHVENGFSNLWGALTGQLVVR